MAVLFEILFVGVLFRLLAFFLGVLASLVGLALEVLAVVVRYVVWPTARWVGRTVCPATRGWSYGRCAAIVEARSRRGQAGQPAGRQLVHQHSVLAGARAALAARE